MSFWGISKTVNRKSKFTALLSVFVMLVSSVSFSLVNTAFAADEDDEGKRAPPEARSSQTLSRQVFTRINEVMELRDMEDLVGAREVMDEIKELYDRDRLNDREKFVMWQFYANLDQLEENYAGATEAYRQMLSLPNLSQDQLEQSMFMLASLYYIQEEFEEAIEQYLEYNEIALEPNEDVFYRLATAYYQTERYADAIPPLLRNMEIVRNKGEEVPKNTYDLLRSLYFSVEDYPSMLQTLREIIVLYNDPDDWPLWPGTLGQLERFTDQAQAYYVAYSQDLLTSDAGLVNFAAQLYNNDYPFGCARVISDGMEEGIIEEDEGNLSFLATCYQLAREDAMAAVALEKAAPMGEDGELYARLGTCIHEYG